MPVSNDSSTPARQAILLGLGLLVTVATAVFLITRFDRNSGGRATQPENIVTLASSEELAAEIRDTEPINLASLAGGNKSIILNHIGDDATQGWFAFLALPDDANLACVIQWVNEEQHFMDPCDNAIYSGSGEGLQQFAVTLNANGEVQIDLDSV